MTRNRRKGRPRLGEEQQRRDDALDAALEELVLSGYAATTMLAVAQRARSSKESLYSWFGSKQGLVAAVIHRESEMTNRNVAALLETDADVRDALVLLATNLLKLLTGERSVAINRAAMASPELSQLLLEHGRHRTGPLVQRYLQHQVDAGRLDSDDVGETFQLLYGLIIQDHQIRVLLGEARPSDAMTAEIAARAVDRFLVLTNFAPPLVER